MLCVSSLAFKRAGSLCFLTLGALSRQARSPGCSAVERGHGVDWEADI